MKKLTLSAILAAALSTTSAGAGSVADPVIEGDLIAVDAGGSSSGTVMTILILSLLLVVADGR